MEPLQAPFSEPGSLDDAFPRVYRELRLIAHRQLSSVGSNLTLDTTSLVHEAYVRLTAGKEVVWNDRTHFVAIAARAMRYVLIDRARARATSKRGGGVRNVTLDEGRLRVDDHAADLLALEEALQALAVHDSRLEKVVELKFFGGLTLEEIARATDSSERTVRRDWQRARVWLYRYMRQGTDST